MPVPLLIDETTLLPRGALRAQLSPADGTGRLSVLGPGPLGLGAHGGIGAEYVPYEVVAFEAPAWTNNGRTPVYWSYQKDPRYGRNVLFIVAGPEVHLSRTDTLLLGSRMPDDLVPEIQIIRVQSTNLVPEPDAPFRTTELIGGAEQIVNGVDLDSEAATDLDAFVVKYLQVPSLERAVILPRPNGVVIEHSLGHWRFAVLAPWEEPCKFAYEVVHSAQKDILNRKLFRLRIVRTANVDLEGFVTTTFVREVLSEVVVEDAVVALGDVPAQGSTLSGYNFRWYDGFRSRFSKSSAETGQVVEMFLGMIPIVGSVIDVGHLMYMANTGETFWGEEVGEEKLFVYGVFALMGVVFDADDGLKVLKKVGDRLAPGADLVKLNPGLVPWLRGRVGVTANPHMLAAVESLGPGELRPMLDSLDEYSAGRRTLGELTETFQTVVLRAYDDTLASGVVPSGIYADAFGSIHPVSLDGFDDLGASAQSRVLEAFDLHRAGLRTVEDVLHELEGSLWRPLGRALEEWRVWRVFSHAFDDFTSASVARGFAKYVSSGRDKNAVQWAIAQQSGRYADELARVLGEDYRSLLKRVAPEKWLNVSDAAKAHFATLVHTVDSYRDLKTVNQGYGHLFEVDHVLEKRFYIGKPSFANFGIHTDDFNSMLVPKNQAVASQLPPGFQYIHAVKTQALRRLIPNGAEGNFSLQAIYDAYVVVFIYELGVRRQIFGFLTHDFFMELEKVSGENLMRVILSEDQLYTRNPAFSRPP